MVEHNTARERDAAPTGWRSWTSNLWNQRRRFATVTIAALAFGVGYHVLFGQNGVTAYEKKKHEEKVLSEQLHVMQDENEALKGHVERLQTDAGAIEHQAREELHYTRPGEVIVTIDPESADDTPKTK